ncbi:MAG: hypothetical protein A2600_09255 [Candidatus Lambdaproteobacteria bacterium RIFOXYD1_FULL_56_27]|uniref:UPF0056 membrane protein n=1 Tax=Candidatus Lambdaproteobacteria bacterium RIFOXYD2_FULL_56_26 TaxID=1817773 RepID=A0A1F6GPF0_9PROT|nr:MAG: hypothetical protein A2557_01360 [Candidatus Lambdaproteobacteria bacterium RIFOXYD2_FULL_56_26]OGH05200.1 MAG: hypothetical protein A2426_00130 [Candidatus Lambdaproteobacteria bacterium RIFOXYC1_FULL_56_13]OGH09827.1 MAG: hypothetical protein A2600_09255 [Candidatus Lambdaproteobacteria bacterium RIFOXYD1_FULL_56_27]
MDPFLGSTTLFFFLLNPFLMSTLLIDLVQGLTFRSFVWVLFKAGAISVLVWSGFATFGEAIFTQVLQVDFEAFMIFGGLILLVIGYRYMFVGVKAIKELRGEGKSLVGSVAMPVMIGPGTISAAVWSGKALGPLMGSLSVLVATLLLLFFMLVFKRLYDHEIVRHKAWIESYIDIAGRLSALLIGSFAVQMIYTGLKDWGFLG